MSYNPQRTSPPSSGNPSRQMQSYQQYLQQQQLQQEQPQPQQQHLQQPHSQLQGPPQQQQYQQQQQHLQSLAVWSPSVPVNASMSPLSSSSPGPVNISGPLDLKTSGPQPILPPVKNTLPPPRPGATPSRSASLRRQLSQNGSRSHGAQSSPNQTFNSNDQSSNDNHNSNNKNNNSNNSYADMSNNSSVTDNYQTPENRSPEHRPPDSNSNSSASQHSSYSRSQTSTPGSSSGASSTHSSGYFDRDPSSNVPMQSSLPGLQRSNSKINYSSPLLRSHSRSGSSSPASSSSPSQTPLRRQTSILKNGSKDAPYLSSKSLHSVSHLESLNQSWEPSGLHSTSSSLVSTPSSPPLSGGNGGHHHHHPSLSQFGSASNLRAMASMSGPASTNMIKVQEMPAQEATLSITSTPASSLPAPSGGPGSHGATSTAENDATGGAQPLPQQELKDQESSHVAARDSTNYKVLVPPSPVVSPRMGPAAGNQNTFNFLNSDPTLQRSSSRRRMAPPIQVPPPPQPQQPHQQQQQQQQQPPSSVLPPQGGPMSPVSPGRRHPYHRWENVMPPNTSGEIAAHPGRELGQGQGQDQQEDGDYEDEGGNDDTDGDVFSGPEDQVDQRRRRYQHQRQKSSGAEGGVPFTPTRSAPQPPNFNGAAQPNSREAEIQHILYIQQQQALFLQEKAMNPPLRSKTSNGNLSGGGSDSSKPKRKGSRHRKQISVISEPRLLSSTNQIKTVPIVRPADQSDNEDAGTKSEYTSGGEGIKSTVRKMRKAVRHAASGVFNDDDSDREDALGSKSDVEKKGGLKQLKALKSKLAKKLHRPSHGGTSSSSRLDQNGSTENAEGENGRGPVQFFSEDNLRARYLAQEQQGGMSLAAAGASLRRSNTTRDNTGGSAVTFKTRDDSREGDKQEYNSVDENKDEDKENAEQKLSPQEQEERDAATKAKMAKFGSRTFDKDEMMEVKDGTGESFFVPRWDLDPRADELGSSKSVISVQSSKKLERSASSSTAASAKTTKLVMSIAERLQGTVVAEEEAEPSATGANASVEASLEPVKDEDFKQATAHSGDGPASDAADSKVTDKEESPVISKKLTEGVPAPEVLSPAFQAEQDAPHGTSSQDDLEQGAGKTGTASIASNSEPDSRASVLSEASNESSVGGLVVAHVLTRQSSMRKNFKRPIKGETKEGATEVVPEKIQQEAPTASAQSSHFGLGISMSTVSAEKQQTGLDEALGDKSAEKQLPPLPQEESKPLSIMTVRPLSPIRRGTAQSAKTSSIASASSILSSPSTPSANAPPSSTSMSPPDAHLNQESSVKNNVERKLSQTSIKSLRALSLSAFSLPQAPTSPLPSPSPTVNTVATIAPPTAPIPGVLTRQGSHLTERASIRSMYADSIYDCYDYDSADDYEGVNAAAHGSRQGSISSTRVPEEDAVFVVSLDATKEEQKEEEEKEVHAESASTGGTTVVEVASAMTVVSSAAQAPDSTVTVVSLSNISESDKGSSASSLSVEKETDLDARSAGMQETLPVIRLRGSSSKKNKDEEIMIMYKDEEHHVHYEDLPKAVPYRMSMMTTVPVDPVGVAASLSGPTLSDNSGLFPSRPPRHPMRQSRHGSIGTLSIGGSSDFTATDSWISSSVRNTRDDLSGWDVDGSVNGDNNNEREQHEQGGRRRSTSSNNSNNSSSHSISVAPLSTGVQQSIDSRSERTMSVMTDKSLIGLLDVVEEKEGDEVREIENPAAVDVAPVAKKQWYNQDRKRETWGSLQSSSSDSATTSSSSSRSSHFYFNGRSPSPSPTEEAAPASKAF